MSKRIRTSNSEMTKFLRGLPRQGFTVEQPKSGHYHICLDGRRVAVMGASPTDAHTAIKTTRTRIKNRTGRTVE
jgi:DNA-binding IclR family transcriptional regulator